MLHKSSSADTLHFLPEKDRIPDEGLVSECGNILVRADSYIKHGSIVGLRERQV